MSRGWTRAERFLPPIPRPGLPAPGLRDDSSDWLYGTAPPRPVRRPVAGEWEDLIEEEFETRAWEGRVVGFLLCAWDEDDEPCQIEARETSGLCPMHHERERGRRRQGFVAYGTLPGRHKGEKVDRLRRRPTWADDPWAVMGVVP